MPLAGYHSIWLAPPSLIRRGFHFLWRRLTGSGRRFLCPVTQGEWGGFRGGLIELMGVVLRRIGGWGLWRWAWVMREKGLDMAEEGGRDRGRGKWKIRRLACKRREKMRTRWGGRALGDERAWFLMFSYFFSCIYFPCISYNNSISNNKHSVNTEHIFFIK